MPEDGVHFGDQGQTEVGHCHKFSKVSALVYLLQQVTIQRTVENLLPSSCFDRQITPAHNASIFTPNALCAWEVRRELRDRTPSQSAHTQKPHQMLNVTWTTESTGDAACRFVKPPVHTKRCQKRTTTEAKETSEGAKEANRSPTPRT